MSSLKCINLLDMATLVGSIETIEVSHSWDILNSLPRRHKKSQVF